MKIEIGESLLCSWLRHVKDCQMVQTNWMASPQWELRNADFIYNIRKKADEYFNNKYGINIYRDGGHSLNQMLYTTEVDVLGISIGSTKNSVFAIDIAFHERGLDYGSKHETMAQVVKKCLQTALCLHGYFNYKEADIIFASPKIDPQILLELKLMIKELNEMFKKWDLNFNIEIVANEMFHQKILEPLLLKTKDVGDTSELFLRGYQMLNMFTAKPPEEPDGNRPKRSLY